jgi:hypothetical protein
MQVIETAKSGTTDYWQNSARGGTKRQFTVPPGVSPKRPGVLPLVRLRPNRERL